MASCTSGGKIEPSGSVVVKQGNNQSFTITANNGYYVKQVLVDGRIVFPVGMEPAQLPTGSYTYIFENVQSDHTIQAVFAPGVLQYVITASAGTGGTIDPSGDVLVPQFGTQSFTITPNTGYHIKDVLVDGVSVGAVSTYTFTNVAANHTIEATFADTNCPNNVCHKLCRSCRYWFWN